MDSIKREYPRNKKKIKAVINLQLHEEDMETLTLSARDKKLQIFAETRDISWGGICVQFETLPKDRENRFSPPKAHTIVGKTIAIKLRDPKLTLWGEVIRFDSKEKQMAILISKVSDYERWQMICNNAEEA